MWLGDLEAQDNAVYILVHTTAHPPIRRDDGDNFQSSPTVVILFIIYCVKKFAQYRSFRKQTIGIRTKFLQMAFINVVKKNPFFKYLN